MYIINIQELNFKYIVLLVECLCIATNVKNIVSDICLKCFIVHEWKRQYF
jgi:hypothetical protein